MLISIELTNGQVLNFDPQTGFTAIWGWHHRDAIQWHPYGGKTIRRILRQAEPVRLQPRVFDLLPAWAKPMFSKAETERRLVYAHHAQQEMLRIVGDFWYGGDVRLPSWCWAEVPTHWAEDKEAVAEAHEVGSSYAAMDLEEERANDARLYR